MVNERELGALHQWLVDHDDRHARTERDRKADWKEFKELLQAHTDADLAEFQEIRRRLDANGFVKAATPTKRQKAKDGARMGGPWVFAAALVYLAVEVIQKL